ncbi:MAG: bifunctional phosphoribosylaminoimidazolecarboxamide formyltransferase/IMP cyclohydrolase [Deltaproteobacteria bacterium]|nr:MAG: bifunctional phosphoribosylaminoimidazolecarboxamide formyltransferase/IMP cyclohydrolase [Deltaproteobacteria bacterium]
MTPPDATTRPVARALLSVSDKRGLIEFARGLRELGVELVGSGGTAQSLRDAGLEVEDVESLTGSPEMLGGRVKTLHPRIHGGILARRDHGGDRADLEMHAISAIDLVVVNLYPFEATVADRSVTLAQAIEKIDIGGPSMIRSAAKNHAYVGVVVDPDDYPAVLAELRAKGWLDGATRARLARKAFERTARYDTAIHAWLAQASRSQQGREAAAQRGEAERSASPRETQASEAHKGGEAWGDPFPLHLGIELARAATLRYGENPHQRAALYGRFFDVAEPLHGKELSFNNIVDVQAALALIAEFAHADRTAVAILKHNTPCGVGLGDTPEQAYRRAFATDPESPFGGIIVASRAFDLGLARAVDEIFTEVLIAPGFDDEALALLQKKKNRRLLRFHPDRMPTTELDLRRVFGGVLVQEPDHALEDVAACRVATQRKPTEAELRALAFGWAVVKHVKSNAVVFASPDGTLAIGGGATSRVDAIHQAREKAARVGIDLRGSALASDAFFPFPDGLEVAAAAGATAFVQPGGSVRDEEVIAAADRLGVAMVFTGKRHFRH